MKKLIAMMLAVLLVLCTAAVSAETPEALSAEELLLSCIGYEGTAGSSLKQAIAAQKVLAFCTENQTAQMPPFELEAVLRGSYDLLNEEQTRSLENNMPSIMSLIETAFLDYESVEGLLESAGIAQDMKQLTESDGAYRHWMAFRTALLSATGKFEEALLDCTGYAGTAGASMKEASAACRLLRFCVDNRLGDVDDAALGYALSEAYAALPQERGEELGGNLERIDRLIEQCYMDYDVYADLFEDAGIGEDMRSLIETEDSYRHWAAFRSKTEELPE